ncbi:hypothetical protein [Cupriavidus oxalaticus]|uniref:Uncharacterized protein n=1 Tax=Cupriavidus oxalaticus TaxID=96344 RepID=A0A375FTB2_9BURK|nr:hypothetical protein [Cupriavidus oxalaticus]QRQ88157.1 hypothetical protein JTE91_16285 [Cupriavidus oxalaticus]QRQ93517.1 hypothetical protein JTE92_25980 [Cupriavidus oxalaticus]WQD82145.1 hypothetical protein U0036_13725 [Cupriavidus oxalaticus]SPC08554.1 conserved membrane hypothetical protein [Cupriavidus oxalaticus]SPC14266.1 conserved membrane hypothetical protein [Cupriavidus oxalaticus]
MSPVLKINRPAVVLFALLFAAMATVHVALYLHGEHHLYVNDFRNYWIAYWKSSMQFTQNIGDWARQLRGEIWASDYNSLPAALLLPFSLVFGYDRYGYILGATLTYLLPVVLLSAKAASLILRDDEKPTLAFVLAAIIAACYVPYWAPTLMGWVDIAGLIPFVLAFVIVRTAGFGKRVRPGMAILFGLLLWMPFLMRRWYAFSIIAFILTAPIYCMVLARIESEEAWGKAFLRTAANFAVAGMFALTCLLIAQGGLVQSILKTSYSSIYIAYQRPPFEHLHDFGAHFGVLYLALALMGQLFIFKSALKRAEVIFINANIFLLFSLFTRTQGFGPHHYLPLAFWVYLLICCGVWQILSSNPKAMRGAIVCVALPAVFVFVASVYRIDSRTKWAGLPRPAYNNQIGYEKVYKQLVYELNEIMKPGETFTVFASSMTLNRDVLLSASKEQLAGKDVDTSHVDLVQGLSVAPFMARYAVVADPIPTHLPEGMQTVITIPAQAILSGRGIGAAYKRLEGKYAITDDVTAYIYEKTRPYTLSEVEILLDDFYKRHPDWRQTYGNLMFKLAMTSELELGDQWGKFEYEPGGRIEIHPGEKKPTRAFFSGVSSELALSVAAPCPGSDGVDVQLNAGGGKVAHFEVAPRGVVNLPTADPAATYELIVSKRANAWCDLVSLTSAQPR